jgi:hypothetical protein
MVDLPLVIEFFDTPDVVVAVLAVFKDRVPSERILPGGLPATDSGIWKARLGSSAGRFRIGSKQWCGPVEATSQFAILQQSVS